MKNLHLTIIIFVIASIFSCSNDDDEQEISSCGVPENITSTNITIDAALISWTEDDNQISVEIEYGLTGFVIGSGTTINSSGNSVLLENLMSETSYDAYVTTICDNRESDLSEVINFTTLPNIFPGDVVLSTQEEVNNFPEEFTQIGGNLLIGTTEPLMSSDIESLAPLENLTNIGGYLHIQSNDNLLSLDGLQNITTLFSGPLPDGGLSNTSTLEINDNALTNIDGLSGLTDMGFETIEIGGNDNLISLSGLNTFFENNSDSPFSLRILSNDALTDLSLQSLTTIGFFTIINNDSLQSLESFENVISGGVLILTDNIALNDFCGLQNLFITGFDTIDIRDNLFNPSIQDIIDGNCSL